MSNPEINIEIKDAFTIRVLETRWIGLPGRMQVLIEAETDLGIKLAPVWINVGDSIKVALNYNNAK